MAVYIKNFTTKSLHQNVYAKSLYQKVYQEVYVNVYKNLLEWKIIYIFINTVRSQKLSLYLLDEISCKYAHFKQVLYAKCYCETTPNEFYANFLTVDICRITNHFRSTCYPILLKWPLKDHYPKLCQKL